MDNRLHKGEGGEHSLTAKNIWKSKKITESSGHMVIEVASTMLHFTFANFCHFQPFSTIFNHSQPILSSIMSNLCPLHQLKLSKLYSS